MHVTQRAGHTHLKADMDADDDLLLWSVSLVSSARAVNTAYMWKSTRACETAQAKLVDTERKLYGLPPAAPKSVTPASTMAARSAIPGAPTTVASTPISPPLRAPRLGSQPTPSTLPDQLSRMAMTAATATPLTAGSTGFRKASPSGGRSMSTTPAAAVMATPQQLSSYLQGFEGAGAAAAQAGVAAGLAGWSTPASAVMAGLSCSPAPTTAATFSVAGGVTPGHVPGSGYITGGWGSASSAGPTPGSGYGGLPGTPGVTPGRVPFSLFGSGYAATPGSASGTPAASGLGPGTSTTSTGAAGAGMGVAGGGMDDVAGDGGDEAGLFASTPVLPFGVEPPKYRPSWLPRARASQQTSSTAGSQEATHVSSDIEAEHFLWDVCKVRQEWLEIWTEKLREWMAGKVFQTLVQAVHEAHAKPNAVLSKYGQQAQLPSLPSVFEIGSGSMAGSGVAIDYEPVLRQAQQVATAMSQSPQHMANPAQAQETKQFIEALIKYEQLVQLLRGKRPDGLLPPCPPGYCWARAQQLAQGPCLQAYNWNGGGPWGGRSWNSDLPTDSSLVLYMFAAFLDAPGWEFGASTAAAAAAAAGPAASSGSTPLYLGAVRTVRPPPQYSAILAYRPDRPGRGVDALLALSNTGKTAGAAAGGGAAAGAGDAAAFFTLPGASMLFCFLAEGRLLALTGHDGLFHTILAFLAYHKAKYNNAVGANYLQDAALQLDTVLQPPKPGSNVAASHSVFGWWFPPDRTGKDKDE